MRGTYNGAGFIPQLGKGAESMATIDVDALRRYLEDYYGTAMFNGFPAALLDLSDISRMSGQELCRHAEELGIDLRKFEVQRDER